MSYDTKGKKKKEVSESEVSPIKFKTNLNFQPLIPNELKQANSKIESELSQFQNTLRVLA